MLEIALSVAYMTAQGFGWKWSEDARPRDAARFSLVYTVTLIVGALIVVIGVDPLAITLMSMALTAALLPIAIVPFLLLMNDPRYVGTHRNGWIGNTVVLRDRGNRLRARDRVDPTRDSGKLMEIALVRDLLDSQIVDRNGEAMGCVDGIVMTWSADAPPRVTHLELGGATLARRLPRPFRGVLEWLARTFTPRGDEPYRIEVARIMHIGRNIQMDIDAARSGRARERALGARPHHLAHPGKLRWPRAASTWSCCWTGRYVIPPVAARGASRRFARAARAMRSSSSRIISGPDAMLERLAAPVVRMRFLRALGLHKRTHGRRATWEQMDLSDPEHPNSAMPVEELAKLVR